MAAGLGPSAPDPRSASACAQGFRGKLVPVVGGLGMRVLLLLWLLLRCVLLLRVLLLYVPQRAWRGDVSGVEEGLSGAAMDEALRLHLSKRERK